MHRGSISPIALFCDLRNANRLVEILKNHIERKRYKRKNTWIKKKSPQITIFHSFFLLGVHKSCCTVVFFLQLLSHKTGCRCHAHSLYIRFWDLRVYGEGRVDPETSNACYLVL